MRTAFGVDVSVSRGLDVVVLDAGRAIVAAHRKRRPADLGPLIADHRPDVVAIDSPPAFGLTGGSRLAERELLRVGVHSYATPSQATERPFYDWMRVGHECFAESDRAGYALFRSGQSVEGRAVEVFPHASAVVLAGRLPPAGWSKSPARKRAWREAVLQANGIRTSTLRTLDQIDAALAALSGLLALDGCFTTVGDADESIIVLPCRTLPTRYEREAAAS